MDINITGLDKAAILAALYNQSKPLGLGLLHYKPEEMTIDEARSIIKNRSGKDTFYKNDLYFDYLNGRVLKIDLSADIIDTWLYDRDNGDGSAFRALKNAGLIQ